jgi:putative endonuclease
MTWLVLFIGVRPAIRQGATSDDVANLKNMYYIYILLLNNSQIYTGFTSDLKRRIQEHKLGKAKFTRQRLPVKLIHYEAYLLKSDAERREKYLKTTEGKRFLKQQLKELFIKLNI